jgi:hypothetical protein
MKLDFYTADILCHFLNEVGTRREFIRCAQEFDDYTEGEVDEMLMKLNEQLIKEMYRK